LSLHFPGGTWNFYQSTGAAQDADTFDVLKMLKVMTQVMTKLYQNTHKALKIQYRYINALFLKVLSVS
jgi:hypothetical protein